MKIKLQILIIGVMFCLYISGCTKNTNDPTGSIPTTGADFVELKIDNVYYRLNESATNGGSATQFVNTSPIFAFGFTFVTLNPLLNVNFSLYNASPIEVKNYTYTTFNTNDYAVFTFNISGNSYYTYSPSSSSTGNIEISKLDSLKGGVNEGTFEFNNLKYYDKDGNLISSNHAVTEGKFKITVK